MRKDQVVARFARAQHGAFTRRQAFAAGFGENAIQHRIETGRWLILAPGIYSVSSARPTWERQMTAAMLSRPGSIAAGSSAAYLHHFTDFREGRPVIMTHQASNARLAIARVIRVSDFDAVSRSTAQGFRVTSVAETLWTLARDLPSQHLHDLVDEQVTMGRVQPADLSAVLDRVNGTRQRGVTNFRHAVRAIQPGSPATAANKLEVLLYRLVSQPGIPPVTRQYPFCLDHPARVDAFIPSWSLVAEADGRNRHARQADFQRDRNRDNALAARGIAVIRFTYEDLTERFDRCLTTLIASGRHRRATNVV